MFALHLTFFSFATLKRGHTGNYFHCRYEHHHPYFSDPSLMQEKKKKQEKRKTRDKKVDLNNKESTHTSAVHNRAT